MRAMGAMTYEPEEIVSNHWLFTGSLNEERGEVHLKGRIMRVRMRRDVVEPTSDLFVSLEFESCDSIVWVSIS